MVRHSQFRCGSMRKLLKRIYLYFKGKEIWDAKMSEHLEITIVSTPKDKGKVREEMYDFYGRRYESCSAEHFRFTHHLPGGITET